MCLIQNLVVQSNTRIQWNGHPEIRRDSIAAKCLRALSGLFSPKLIDQSSCMILTIHAKTRPILHDDWSIRLGENRLYRSSKTFGSYARRDNRIAGKHVSILKRIRGDIK